MAARAVIGDPAMVDDENQAIERVADEIASLDELSHVLGLVFITDQGAVERIDDDDDRLAYDLSANSSDQLIRFRQQIEGDVEQIERHRLIGVLDQIALSPRFDPVREAAAAFEREIDDRAALHLATAIFAPKSDMHHEIEYPKGFSALRW